MKNYVSAGDTVQLTAPSGGVVSGTPVLIGRLLVVPVATVAETLAFAGRAEGVFAGMVKHSGTAWTEGETIFWDDSAKNFTTVATANTAVGHAVVAAGSSDVTGTVRLDPTVSMSAVVAALAGTMTGTTDGTIVDAAASACAGGSSPSAANVDTCVGTLATSVNLQLKELQTKLNELIGVL